MRTFMAFAAVLFTGLVLAAEPAPATGEDDVGLKPGFYIEPGVSALIFSGPERSVPIYEVTAPGAMVGRAFSPVEEEEVAPAARLALGFVFEDTPSWMGKDFRAEVSTNFWWVNSDETQALTSVAAGNLAGTFLFDESLPGTAIDGVELTPVAGFPMTVEREGEYRYVDGNLTLKTDYAVSDLISFSPSVAFMYANLDYDAEVIAARATDASRLKERLDTDYVGATIGLDLNLKPTNRLTITVGGTVSPLWSDTDLKGFNSEETLVPPAIVNAYGFRDEDDEFTFRATGMGSVAYQPLSWFKVTAFGGVEYWDKVARVDYPNYPVGLVVNVGTPGYPKIGYDSMTNFRAGLNFTFIIGK